MSTTDIASPSTFCQKEQEAMDGSNLNPCHECTDLCLGHSEIHQSYCPITLSQEQSAARWDAERWDTCVEDLCPYIPTSAQSWLHQTISRVDHDEGARPMGQSQCLIMKAGEDDILPGAINIELINIDEDVCQPTLMNQQEASAALGYANGVATNLRPFYPVLKADCHDHTWTHPSSPPISCNGSPGSSSRSMASTAQSYASLFEGAPRMPSPIMKEEPFNCIHGAQYIELKSILEEPARSMSSSFGVECGSLRELQDASDVSRVSGEHLSTEQLFLFPGQEFTRAATSPGTSTKKRHSARPQRASALSYSNSLHNGDAYLQAAELSVVPKKRNGSGYQAGVTFPNPRGLACSFCGATMTPVWRAGPDGPKTLCNACGVRYMKVAKKK